MGRWVGGIVTRIAGGHHAHAARPRQLAVLETNNGLAWVVNPHDHFREGFFGGGSRKADVTICLLGTNRGVPTLPSDMNFRFSIGKATEAGCLCWSGPAGG
jgi:hypothetical protein